MAKLCEAAKKAAEESKAGAGQAIQKLDLNNEQKSALEKLGNECGQLEADVDNVHGRIS